MIKAQQHTRKKGIKSSILNVVEGEHRTKIHGKPEFIKLKSCDKMFVSIARAKTIMLANRVWDLISKFLTL